MKKTKKQWYISAIAYLLLFAIILSAPMLISAEKGSFKTQNDITLKLRVDWETDYVAGSDFVTVTAKVYLEHNSIFVSARTNGSVSINGTQAAFSTPAIRQESNARKETLLTTHTVKITYKAGETLNADIYAKWYFGGVYANKKTDWLEATGKLTFDGANASVTPGGNSVTPPVAPPVSPPVNPPVTPVTPPADTDNPAMGGASLLKNGVIKSNTGANIDLRAVWEAYESTEGMVSYIVMLYLDHSSIQMRARNGCKLTVGDTVVTYDFPGANITNTARQSTILAAAIYEAPIDAAITISANFPVNGVFSGKQVGEIKISSNVSAK